MACAAKGQQMPCSLSNLTLRHRWKCSGYPTGSVEDCPVAIGNNVAASHIKLAFQINKAMVVFSLSEGLSADELIESGLTINGV